MTIVGSIPGPESNNEVRGSRRVPEILLQRVDSPVPRRQRVLRAVGQPIPEPQVPADGHGAGEILEVSLRRLNG